MQRRVECIVCGEPESSIAYASDPWCCDLCHKKVAKDLGVDQRELSSRLFWIALDRAIEKVSDVETLVRNEKLWDLLKGQCLDSRHADYLGNLFGFSGETLFKHSQEPADWSRRVVFLSSSPWGWQVRQLQESRNEA